MQPTVGNVFVKKADKQKLEKGFDIVDNSEAKYEVTAVADGIAKCCIGDYVLFTDYKTYKFEGGDIYIVSEDDIKAVKTNSELKK
jgi:co-chaperonin GroES (HSP10)